MADVVRIGDPMSSGGVVVTGAEKTIVGCRPVARQGDIVICMRHGVRRIVTGSSKALVEKSGIARLGDIASCGCVVIGTAWHMQA